MNVLKTGLEFSDGPKKKPTFIWNSKLIDMYDNEEKYGKKHSMPSPYFMNKFGLKKSDMIFKHTDAEIEEIRKCAGDIVYFAEKYCKTMTDDGISNITLRDYQKRILRDMMNNRFIVWVATRQIGKCSLASTNIEIENKGKLNISDIYTNIKPTKLNKLKNFLYKLYNKL